MKSNEKCKNRESNINLRIIGVLLVLLAVFASPALSAPNITASVTQVTVAKGETEHVQILLNPNEVGISVYQLQLAYDESIINTEASQGNGPFMDSNMNFFSLVNPSGRFTFGGTTTAFGAISVSESSNIAEVSIVGNNTGQTTITLNRIQLWGLGSFDVSGLEPSIYYPSNVTITVNVVDPSVISSPQTSVGDLTLTNKVGKGIDLGYARVEDQITVFGSIFDGTRSVVLPVFDADKIVINATFMPYNCSGSGTIIRQNAYPKGYALRTNNCKIQSFLVSNGQLVYNDGTGGFTLSPYQLYNVTVEYDWYNLTIYTMNSAGNKVLYSRVTGTGKGVDFGGGQVGIGQYIRDGTEGFKGEILKAEISTLTQPVNSSVFNVVPAAIFDGTRNIVLPAFDADKIVINATFMPYNCSGSGTIIRQNAYPKGYALRTNNCKIQSFLVSNGQLVYNDGTGGFTLSPYQLYNVTVEYDWYNLTIYTMNSAGNKVLYSRVTGTGKGVDFGGGQVGIGQYIRDGTEGFKGEISYIKLQQLI